MIKRNQAIFLLRAKMQVPAIVALAGFALLFGCTGSPIPSERAARRDLALVASRYRPGDAKAELPVLTGKSGIEDYLRFAMLNNPGVEAAYHEWAASIEHITTARSRPDPRLTFKADIASMVMSAMAGLMVDLPGPGKLRAAGNVAAAESQGRYFAFEMEVLRTAFAVKSAYYRLQFLEDEIRVQRATLKLLSDLEELARQHNAAGRTTLQDVLQAQIEQEQIKTRIENLEDSRGTLLAELKAALGLGTGDAGPPIPAKFISSGEIPDREKILEIAQQRNPVIQQMTADVRRAQSMLDLARKAGVPDFSIGIGADFKASPTMWTPSASVTLPIWRDKIAAQIAGAQVGKRAAEARLNREQVQLAAELAAMLYMYHESARVMELLDNRLIPKGRQSLEAARTGYANGKSGFLDVIEGYRQLLSFDLALIEARTQKELALASLSLLIAGVPPQDSPTLAPAERSSQGNSKEVWK
ncbi:MAG: TolC family protein [Phycisphaerae bacterium]